VIEQTRQVWPTQIHYQDALQDPARCFSDPRLRAARPVDIMPYGLPRPITGQFANVYRLECADGKHVAARLFLTPLPDRAERYAAVGAHLASLDDSLAALVPFSYLADGIQIAGGWFPIVVMDWVEGAPLQQFVERHLYDSDRLARLADQWAAVVASLRAARVAHGDLQHSNILVADGAEGAPDRIRLIDYDAMWTPTLDGRPAPESGHPAYQHGARTSSDYGLTMDRFPALVIYAALRAVAAAPELWYRLHDGDNLIFRREDLSDPETGRAWKALREALPRSPDVARIIRELKEAASGPLYRVPSLDRVVLY
jgi:hypothetical protein